MIKLPESPNWIVALSQKKSNSEALVALEWIYRKRHVNRQKKLLINLRLCSQAQKHFFLFSFSVQLSTFYYHQLIDNENVKANRLENEDTDEDKTLLELSKEPQVYKPLIILLFIFLFQQLSGCYVLIFYTINIFRNLSLNFSEKINENMALMLLGTLRLIMSVIASGYEIIK